MSVGLGLVLSLSACYSGPVPPATPTPVMEKSDSSEKSSKPTPPEPPVDDLPVLR